MRGPQRRCSASVVRAVEARVAQRARDPQRIGCVTMTDRILAGRQLVGLAARVDLEAAVATARAVFVPAGVARVDHHGVAASLGPGSMFLNNEGFRFTGSARRW